VWIWRAYIHAGERALNGGPLPKVEISIAGGAVRLRRRLREKNLSLLGTELGLQPW
jgi:hypothetical protein